MTGPLLELARIEKSFFGVPVLKQIGLRLAVGETLGLVGENGAGKSTLMNILGGVVKADAGHMLLSGSTYAPRSAQDATKAGVAFIHQELNLFPNLSIAENVFLTSFPCRAGCIDRAQLRRRTTELMSQVGLNLSPTTHVDRLSPGEKQLVEMVKALSIDARLIILDEPTTSLTAPEIERLFVLLRSLRELGIGMIYISHTLADVQRLCDRIIVLRDGDIVGEGPIHEFDTNRVVSLMVGRKADQVFPERTTRPTNSVALSVHNVTQPGIVHDISLSVNQGEILGLSGLMGSGRSELARILFGLDPLSTGRIELNGQRIERLSTRDRISRGMAMLTESRRDDGLCMNASIAENLSLVAARRFSRPISGLLKLKRLMMALGEIRQRVMLTPTARLNAAAQTLSGGNQQKVVLAKWLLNNPSMLILDEPTRGIDVGAKFEIYALINQLAATCSSILIISSELEELIGLCDRIVVINRGEIRDELSRVEFDRNRIMRAAMRADQATTGVA